MLFDNWLLVCLCIKYTMAEGDVFTHIILWLVIILSLKRHKKCFLEFWWNKISWWKLVQHLDTSTHSWPELSLILYNFTHCDVFVVCYYFMWIVCVSWPCNFQYDEYNISYSLFHHPNNFDQYTWLGINKIDLLKTHFVQ